MIEIIYYSLTTIQAERVTTRKKEQNDGLIIVNYKWAGKRIKLDVRSRYSHPDIIFQGNLHK